MLETRPLCTHTHELHPRSRFPSICLVSWKRPDMPEFSVRVCPCSRAKVEPAQGCLRQSRQAGELSSTTSSRWGTQISRRTGRLVFRRQFNGNHTRKCFSATPKSAAAVAARDQTKPRNHCCVLHHLPRHPRVPRPRTIGRFSRFVQNLHSPC